MVILIVLVVLVAALFIYWYALYYKYDRYLRKYPGPRPLPILGNALLFKSLEEFIPTQNELRKKYGPVVKLTLGFFPPCLNLSEPKLLESILGSTKLLHKGRDYEYLHSWLGTGLLTSEPAKWKKHRKILTPAFHFQILEQFVPTFSLYADILVNRLKNETGNKSFDIYPYITLCSLDIICATSMGTTVNAQLNGTSSYVKSVQEMSKLVLRRMMSVIPDFIYPLTSAGRAEAKLVKILHGYTNSVITSRKRELHNMEKLFKDSQDEYGIKKKRTFLDILLQYKIEGGSITDEEIREEVDTFMFEGHDTTASAVTFVLYCLANHPEIQQKTMNELNSIFTDDPDRPANSRDLSDMKYLEMVIKETLRLYPPVPAFNRNVEQDTEFGGGVLPKGISLSLKAFAVHRDPKIFPDPERFDPERFTAENQAKRSLYAYIPFSAGSRNCIGQRFAMMEAKSVVSKVLRTYKLYPAVPKHELILVPALVLKSTSGVHIRLEKRK